MDFIKVFKQELFSLWINKEKDIYNLNNTFDLFSILRNENDEVNLHSKFIYFLLNPLANHFQKSLFLKLFLNIIGETFDNSGFYMVKKEHKNIDLLITKDQTAIIIENKIDASDEDRQLERYYETLKTDGFLNIKIFYLTKFGRNPSPKGLGKLKLSQINKISYENEILNWINQSISSTKSEPFLNESLKQYRNLLRRLCGKSPSRELIMQLKDALLNTKNLNFLFDLENALIEAKAQIQMNFWQDLTNELSSFSYSFKSDNCDFDTIKAYCDPKEKSKLYYGIFLPLRSTDNNNEIVYKIEIDHNIYYGFVHQCKNNQEQIKIEGYEKLIEKVISIDKRFNQNFGAWLGWKYSNEKINFRSFEGSALRLLEDGFQEKLIKDICDEIHQHIQAFN